MDRSTFGSSSANENGHEVLQYRQPDGTTATLRLDISHIDVAGRAACLVVGVDLTEESRALAKSERDRTELAMSESTSRRAERRLRQLFETASDWYWEADSQGVLTFVSENFERMFGISASPMSPK